MLQDDEAKLLAEVVLDVAGNSIIHRQHAQ